MIEQRTQISNILSLGIGGMITLIVLFGVYQLLNSYIEKSIGFNYQHARNEAVDQCMKEARSVVANVFNESLYRVCLQDKGFVTSLPK
ncbi:MAG: hypothetical protein UZ22_OP11002000377 [Microgenomates bacterium OLB23]|nr:MAG: hypothetical protein UZ22_OP11002000377 [Microgenomates bacterium OLB23]